MQFLRDILQTNDPEKEGGDRYSLSRTLLLASSLLYLFAGVFGYFSIFTDAININTEALSITQESLRWLIVIFAGYAFGGKFLSTKTNKMPEKK